MCKMANNVLIEGAEVMCVGFALSKLLKIYTLGHLACQNQVTLITKYPFPSATSYEER